MIKWLRNNKGFTLIEIMVSLAILGIILVPISSMFLTTVKTNQKSKQILLANQLAQQYMEKLKASANPMTEIVPPIDGKTGLYIEKLVEVYKEGEFVLPSDGGSSNEYESIIDLINIEDEIVFVYDGEGNYEGNLTIKKNESAMNNFDIILNNNQLILQGNSKDEQVVVELSSNMVDIKIMINSDINLHIKVDATDNSIINVYTNRPDVFKKIDLGDDSTVVVHEGYMEEGSSETANLLYKVTVIVKDKTNTEELTKLVSLKKAE